MELSKEQIAYLKSLDSKKKKRKFLLDCLIENIEISKIEMHFSYAQKPIDESEKNEKCVLCQIFPREENSIKCESCSCAIKHVIQNDPFFQKFITKPNYSTEEIELAKHNINQREVAEQGSELLKFDKLEDESLTQNDLEGNSVVKTEEAVKITLEDGTIIWKTKWTALEEPKKDKGLYRDLISIILKLPERNFVSMETAMEIEKTVLKYHEIAK